MGLQVWDDEALSLLRVQKSCSNLLGCALSLHKMVGRVLVLESLKVSTLGACTRVTAYNAHPQNPPEPSDLNLVKPDMSVEEDAKHD